MVSLAWQADRARSERKRGRKNKRISRRVSCREANLARKQRQQQQQGPEIERLKLEATLTTIIIIFFSLKNTFHLSSELKLHSFYHSTDALFLFYFSRSIANNRNEVCTYVPSLGFGRLASPHQVVERQPRNRFGFNHELKH